ncbi:MAG: hypothetical protein EHM32_02400 [Spirochaetales bacterium]|nr:MAG: hypothetical protein EHM32_02400 [Spirochaetales bacterium]
MQPQNDRALRDPNAALFKDRLQPYHWLKEDGKDWLKKNSKLIELHRLPPYSPELNPIEGVWKITRKTTTHNRFFNTTAERDAALRKTFTRFQQHPVILLNQVRRFQ